MSGARYGLEPYQGTTSVVPTIMAGLRGFSPWAADLREVE
jgi:hypothetical protein